MSLCKKWFVIEGNIGSGKSTLCKMLENQSDNIEVICEPVQEWKNMFDDNTSKNLLQVYYEDQNRWGFTFQLFGLFTRIKDVLNPQVKDLRFVERSIFSYKNVFTRFLFEKGKISSLEWKMYNEWFNWLSNDIFHKKTNLMVLFISGLTLKHPLIVC